MWCQPGTTNDECEAYIEEHEMSERVIFGGPCLLVIGDSVRSAL